MNRFEVNAVVASQDDWDRLLLLAGVKEMPPGQPVRLFFQCAKECSPTMGRRLMGKYRALKPWQQLAFRVTSWVIVLASLLAVYLIPIGSPRHHNSAELRALKGPVPPAPATDKEKIQTYDAIVSFEDAHQGAVALSTLAGLAFLVQGIVSFLGGLCEILSLVARALYRAPHRRFWDLEGPRQSGGIHG